MYLAIDDAAEKPLSVFCANRDKIVSIRSIRMLLPAILFLFFIHKNLPGGADLLLS